MASIHVERSAMPYNFAPSPEFRWLCEELFVKLDNVQKQQRGRGAFKSTTVKYFEIISFFVKLWRKTVGDDIYPALTLILPYRDRRILNIKDFTLIKAICIYLKLPKNSPTERRLLRWKRRAGKGFKLSDFCVDEIRKRKSEPSHRDRITIEKLNECLDTLAVERSTKGRGFKGLSESASFKYCLENMTFTELKYYFDIILKSRVIAGQEHKFLSCWHPDARDYLSVVSDLKTVAEKLWNPTHRLRNDDLSINLGLPFAPYLAKRLHISYDKASSKLKNDFYIEEKMDGERIQLHVMNYGKQLKWFSRRGTDYTYLYGADVNSGTVAQYIHLDPKVKNCVLDGEMVSFDTNRNVVLPFGLVKSSARDALTPEGVLTKGYQPLLMVLDLLYLNGVSLVKAPLHIRKQYLSSILKPHPRAVEIIRSVRCFDDISIKNSLKKAIAMGSEGIILKQFKSKYHIGARTDQWIKIKPEYLEQFGENLDLIVIGRTPGKKDSLMCGLVVLEGDENLDNQPKKDIINLDSDEDEEPRKIAKKIVSFCTIANGISQEEFKEIERKTAGRWNKTESRSPPGFIEFGSKVPEEWIYPTDSIVLEIKARSLDNTESSGTKFKTGCTLYGAYCRRIRDDKIWTDCYTLSDLRQERKKNFPVRGNFTTQKSLRRKREHRIQGSSPLNQTLWCNDEFKTSHIFHNLSFYVMSDFMHSRGHIRITKEELCTIVLKNGGKLIYNVISRHGDLGNLRIVSGKYTLECKALINRGYDILSPQWILDCVSNNTIVKLEPRHCFSVSEKMQTTSKDRVDCFNDSYEATINEDRLSEIFQFTKEIPRCYFQPTEDIRGLGGIPLFLFSKRLVFVPDSFSYLTTETLKQKIKFYGGEVTFDIRKCNLIVIPDGGGALLEEKLNNIREILSTFATEGEVPTSIPRIVTTEWVNKSIEENCQVAEEGFLAL
ncbi:ZYBA0S04-03598g1_1 [Zygosaccharomyces bailii CLIB 213]|uniref:DNA ligase n=1 Tax=Zygosaccharomyces bailii (strain CLIB 213 / ATCC 58445 / CBS 680 / BCRC 21525 / NBRC 1098 / NCYC 1416 / NRRL Y-2227) TaxID=1333698 RepID=A0A8J2T7F4_ZYGB2|nr:ZYBA0S04-03598g1_1 [Zygosaccharomyces bailii CLIB 213]